MFSPRVFFALCGLLLISFSSTNAQWAISGGWAVPMTSGWAMPMSSSWSSVPMSSSWSTMGDWSSMGGGWAMPASWGGWGGMWMRKRK
ncbi:hypothetical protein TYRP_006347 [Tyrophagus putrescentiae]|nr:hypothetical protein TYRP_006347 [Tyrophagus putrescentiae]